MYTARAVYNNACVHDKTQHHLTTFSDGMKVASIQHMHASRHACFGREGLQDGTLLFWCRELDMPCGDFRDGKDHTHDAAACTGLRHYQQITVVNQARYGNLEILMTTF